MDTQKIKKIILTDLKREMPQLVEGTKDFSLRRLSSKKNIVYNLSFEEKPKEYPKNVILKLYRTDYADIEYNALKKLIKQKIPVPEIIFFKKPYIILKEFEGVNLCDFINDNLINITSLDDLESEIREEILLSIKKLAEWTARLHSQNIITKKNIYEIIVFNKGDTRLRDFIYNRQEKEIYGLDFEESYEGNFLDDLAWICCSLIDTNPGILEYPEPKHKMDLINYFLKEYFHINHEFIFLFDYFADKLIDDLNIVIERRGLELSSVRKKVILGNISK